MSDIWRANQLAGRLTAKGEVVLANDSMIGSVTPDGHVLDRDGNLVGSYDSKGRVFNALGHQVASIEKGKVFNPGRQSVAYVKGSDTVGAGAAFGLLILPTWPRDEPGEPPPPPRQVSWVAILIGLFAVCFVGIYLIASIILYGPMALIGSIACLVLVKRALAETLSDPSAASNPFEAATRSVRGRRVLILSVCCAALVGFLMLAPSLFGHTNSGGLALIAPAFLVGIFLTSLISKKIIDGAIRRAPETLERLAATPNESHTDWKLVQQIIIGGTLGLLLIDAVGFIKTQAKGVAGPSPVAATNSPRDTRGDPLDPGDASRPTNSTTQAALADSASNVSPKSAETSSTKSAEHGQVRTDVSSVGNAKDGSAMPGENFPETRLRDLTTGDVSSWKFAKVRYAINEMFARHGARFTVGYIQRQFEKMSWYKPVQGRTPETAAVLLTDMEKRNLVVLGKRRNELERLDQTH